MLNETNLSASTPTPFVSEADTFQFHTDYHYDILVRLQISTEAMNLNGSVLFHDVYNKSRS